MRVITGSARGKRLEAPKGMNTRPTPERVKEALFSAIQFDIEGRRILDLFAGSGQLGIEALSRGAESAVFVDSDAEACSIIKNNLNTAGFSQKSKIFNCGFDDFFVKNSDTFDIAFLDPPYSAGFWDDALKRLNGCMSSYGIIICEHPSDMQLPDSVRQLRAQKSYKYGKVMITMFRMEDGQDE